MKIAITGKMCSGKSTLAKIIQKLYPEYKIFSYGGKVKQLATDLFNMDQKDRSLLINVATKMREINEDVWSNYVLNQTKNEDNCIIDDLRFQNELDGLMNDDSDWIIIQLDISLELQTSRIMDIYKDKYEDHILNRKHISEKSMLNYQNNYPSYKLNSDDYDLKQIEGFIKSIIV